MAVVTGFLVCESIEQIPQLGGGEPKMKIIGPLSGARLKYIPTLYSMNLVICMNGVNFHEQNTIRIKMRLGAESMFDTFDIDLKNVEGPDNPDGGILLSLNLNNFEIKETGDYYFDIDHNGQQIGSYLFPVSKE
mgnify:CR=1 FL=1